MRRLLRRLGLLPERDATGPEPAEPRPPHGELARIAVRLPPGREAPGTLRALDGEGRLVSGPWPAVGKADPALAAARGNPACDRLRRCGDTPTGGYHILGRLPPPGDARLASRVGPHGALVLRPVSGEAALADANGRTTLLIHGGGDHLAPTDGSLRVPDAAVAEMVALLPAEPDLLQRVRVEVEDGADGARWAEADGAAGSPARQVWFGRSRAGSGGPSGCTGAGVSDEEWDLWLLYQNQLAMLNALDGAPPAHDREQPAGWSKQGRAAAAALGAAGFDVRPDPPPEAAPEPRPPAAEVSGPAHEAPSAPLGSPDRTTPGSEPSYQPSGGAYDR